MGARVVLIRRNDTISQAAIGYFLGLTAERSVWTKSASKKIHCGVRNADFRGCYEQLQHIANDEQILQAVESSEVASQSVTMETFVSNQSAETNKLAAFLDVKLQEGDELKYSEGYETAADLIKRSERFRRELIDKIGLHMDFASVFSEA